MFIYISKHKTSYIVFMNYTIKNLFIKPEHKMKNAYIKNTFSVCLSLLYSG